MIEEEERLIRLKPNLERRALILEFTRAFFLERGFLEVETPIRVPSLAPEEQIVPFKSEDWFLATSPELYMKRLLAAGYDRIFQLSHCFRQGEQGRHHNPEFTMLEWYRAGADYQQMVRDTEALVITLDSRLGLNSVIQYQNQSIDLTPLWPVVTVRNAFIQAAGWDPIAEPNLLRFDNDLVTKVIPSFNPAQPMVLLDYPAAMASLARLNPNDSQVAERAEIFMGGLELANAYSELRDRKEQEQRFLKEIAQIQREQGRRITMPQRFLEAVPHLPECGGIALGMDRLVMLFCNAAAIDEVMPFTLDTA